MISIVLKTTTRRKRCQEKFKDILPSPEIQSNPAEYFSLCSKTVIRLLKQIFYYHRRRNIFSVSQSWLASQCGVSREWINKLLSQLEANGILKMCYLHKQKSYYRVSSFFTDKVIASLAHLWRAWPLTLLVSNPALNAVSGKSSQLLKEDTYIINNNININKGKIITSKKESVMQELYGQKIIPYVEELKSIRPTTWGQVYLSAFPKEVVLHADQVTLKNVKKLSTNLDRWKYLLSVCKGYCKDNDIQTSWPAAFDVGKELGMPAGGPYFDDNFIITINNDNNNKRRFARREERSFNGNAETVRKSISLVEAAAHNAEMIRMYNPSLYAEREAKRNQEKPLSQDPFIRQQERNTREWEDTRINDPVKFARLETNAQQFRKILGLNEDGTFQPGHTPEQAIDKLTQIYNTASMREVVEKNSVSSPKEKCARAKNEDNSGFYDTAITYSTDIATDMDAGIELEDYSVDWFGDRN
jgi:hypothetical protein